MNKKNFLLFGAIVLFGCSILIYYQVPINVNLELLSSTPVNIEIQMPYWQMVRSYDIEIIKKYEKLYGILLPEFDPATENLVVSFGKRIETMTYQRKSKYDTPYKEKPYIANTKYANESCKNIVFIYITDKVNVTYDSITWK